MILLVITKKTKSVLSGVIDIEELVKIFRETSVLNEVLNIRSSMKLLDIVFKYLMTISKTIKNISNLFDDHIVYRYTHNEVDKKKDRDELCLNKLYIPNGTVLEPTEYNKECLPMVNLIEPYTNLEKNRYTDEELKKFNVGINIYTSPTEKHTIDVFSAGLSGHTINILLLMTIFVFNKLKKENVYLIIYSCLIFMLNYYHHSLREIVIIAFIFIDDAYNRNILLKLFTLYDESKRDNYKEYIDDVFEMLEKELCIFNNIKIYKPDYPMVESETLLKTLLKNIDSKTNEENMIKFIDLIYSIKQNINLELPL